MQLFVSSFLDTHPKPTELYNLLDALNAVGTVFSKDRNGHYSATVNYYGHLNKACLTLDTGTSNKGKKTIPDDDDALESPKKATSYERDEITDLSEGQAEIFKVLMANRVNVVDGKGIALKFNDSLALSCFIIIDDNMSHKHAIKAC